MRYIPHTAEEVKAMLEALGLDSINDLFEQVPYDLRREAEKLSLPKPMSEIQLERHIGDLAAKNRVSRPDTVSFLGAGLYEHVVPSAISQLLLRAEFLTSYTPYQPEISQGTTKAIFEFQSMVSELLDMPIANASMYDGAHATAEAALMSQRVTRRGKVLVSKSVHPEYRQVVQTYLRFQPGNYVEFDFDAKTGRVDLNALQTAAGDADEVACVIFQTPNFLGILEEPGAIVEWTHANKIMVVACFNEPHAFAVSTPPGTFGVDICVGEGMGLGVGLSYGGPGLGIFSCREQHIRSMPGRLSGRTVDSEGREGYVLTLSTREQHIRREKATSNICTNQGLMALAAAMYMSLLGKQGIREVAELNMARAQYARQVLHGVGRVEMVYDAPFFNEFVVELPSSAKKIIEEALSYGIVAGYDLGRVHADWARRLLIAATEMTGRASIDRLAGLLSN